MINEPYILFTRIPLVKNNAGEIYCDQLWAKDLRFHINYIKKFGICCPVEINNKTEGLINLKNYNISPIFALHRDFGIKSVLSNFFPNFFVVAKACKHASIVHSGGGGWAFPLSFYILFIRIFIKFKWIILIESSFWMLDKEEKKTSRRLFEHYTHKFLLKRCLKLANARIFTQSFYRKYFLKDDRSSTLIYPAIWIDKDDILTPNIVNQKWKSKTKNPISIIFPSRLITSKGVFVVFDAIKKLKDMDVQFNLTIMGAGELEDDCKQFAANDYGKIKINYQKPVSYGKTFFNEISRYNYVLVPTLKQEQPRIIFDAFSQGIAIIGSDTYGILDITNKNNALIFKTGDSSSLANVIYLATKNPEISYQMGLAGLSHVEGKTHLKMHQIREEFLKNIFDISE